MKVSIFSAPDLIVTELSNYLPPNTSELVTHSTSVMQNSVLCYANNIPCTIFELTQKKQA